VTAPIEGAKWPGSIYQWKEWRNDWQITNNGTPDPSYYWYAPQFRVARSANDDQDLFEVC
jgi:hypothetical protein